MGEEGEESTPKKQQINKMWRGGGRREGKIITKRKYYGVKEVKY